MNSLIFYIGKLTCTSFIFIVPPLPVNYASDFSISMHKKMYIHIRAHSESIIYMFIVEQRRGNSFNI